MQPRFLAQSQIDKVLNYAEWKRSFLNEWTLPEQEKTSALFSLIESFAVGQVPLKIFIVDVDMVIVRGEDKDDPPTLGVYYPYGGEEMGGELYLAAQVPKDVLLENLAHEFCHYTQDVEPGYSAYTSKHYSELFIKYTPRPGELIERSPGDSEADITEAFKQALKHEMNCNSRAFRLIQELDLPLDHSTFWKRANAYHLFYYEALKRKSWYKTDPATHEKIYSQMFDKEIPDTGFAFGLYSINADIFKTCF